MAGNDYRDGRKRVEVLLPVALHANVRAAAQVAEVSMSEWVVEALRERVMRDGDGGVGSGRGRSAASDGGRPRSVAFGGGGVDAVLISGDVFDEVTGSLSETQEFDWGVPVRLVDPFEESA